MAIVGLQTHIWQNKSKSIFLLALFPLILLFIVFVIILAFVSMSNVRPTDIREIYSIPAPFLSNSARTPETLLITFVLFKNMIGYVLMAVGAWFLIAWGFHKSMILGMTGASLLERKDNPRVYNIVENLCISRGSPVPKIYIIDDESLNAFASGMSPKNSLIAFSKGILDKLNDKELEAVAAHELTHILNYDIRLMVICIIFVGIIQTISEVFLRLRVERSRGNRRDSGDAVLVVFAIKLIVFLLGFLFTLIVQMAISRKREYLADAGSVELTKSSEGLVSALGKIAVDSRIEVIENRSVAQMCIENPLSKNELGIMAKLFSTHPPIKERIEALRAIG